MQLQMTAVDLSVCWCLYATLHA